MNDGDVNQPKEWSRDQQKLAVLTWLSFLCAAIFSIPLFAFIDPLIIVDALNISGVDSRYAGYAIGFFFLFCNAWVSGWFTLRLVRRKRTGPVALPRQE